MGFRIRFYGLKVGGRRSHPPALSRKHDRCHSGIVAADLRLRLSGAQRPSYGRSLPPSEAQKAHHHHRPGSRLPVAIVLLSTAVEQSLNFFYRSALEENELLTVEEATEIIRSNNIGPK